MLKEGNHRQNYYSIYEDDEDFKVLSVMMIVALSAGFASCSNDDDEMTSETLVGTWETTWEEGWSKNTEDPTDLEEWNDACSEEDKYQMTFKADGTGIDGVSDSFTWKLDGNVLTITNGEDTESAKVLKLTESEIVIEVTYKDGKWESYEKTTYKRVK